MIHVIPISVKDSLFTGLIATPQDPRSLPEAQSEIVEEQLSDTLSEQNTPSEMPLESTKDTHEDGIHL